MIGYDERDGISENFGQYRAKNSLVMEMNFHRDVIGTTT